MSKKLSEFPRGDGSINDPSTPLFQRDSSREVTGGKKLMTRSRILITVAFIISVTVVLTVVLAVTISSSNKDKGNGCAIPGACDSQVLAYIDTRFHPCEDFFNYSCGKWLSDNPLGDLDELNMFSVLHKKNLNDIARYLSHSVSDRDSEAIKKSKYMFSACTDVTRNDLDKHILNLMASAGGWVDIGIPPGDDWDFDNLTNDHYIGSPAFLKFELLPDDLNSSRLVIKIEQSGLSLETPDAYENETSLLNLAQRISGRLQCYGNSSFPAEHYNQIARGIVYYEKSLAKYWLTETELRNYTLLYNPMSLRELSELFPMDWVNYFNTYFSKAGFSGDFTEDSVVIVQTVNYIKSLNFTITRDTVNYAKWQLLQHEFNQFAFALGDSNWDIFHKKKYLKSSKYGDSDNLACAELVEQSMPLAVARPFVEEFITARTITTVNETTNQIEKAFVQRVMEKHWLDQYTKDQCVEKVNAITRQIAYPDFIKVDKELDEFYSKLAIHKESNAFDIAAAVRDFKTQQFLEFYTKPIDKTWWIEPPTEVNAAYFAPFNQFSFLAGILQPPFFATTWPPFLLYGAIGTVIGHELSHGFDDGGQQFNKDGNRVKWWTDESIRQFQNRTQCFVDQYDQYSLLGVKINGELTLGENIADNGGVHTAYHAYKNVMNGRNAQSYGGHTEDQLFFVAYAQWHCSQYTVAALEKSTKTDEHSPESIRVLGSLVNSEEFTKAFQCSKGSTMYPSDDRCELW